MFFSKQMDKKVIYKYGIGGGVAEIIYVLLVALLFSNLENFLPTPPALFGFFFFLLLFVFSAAVSGFLVLGYPLYLAMQKRFSEAIMCLLTTLLTLFLGFVIIILLVLLIK
ncbi:MAG: hypothetical protein WC460_06180 [Patescibacteria group bacterium]